MGQGHQFLSTYRSDLGICLYKHFTNLNFADDSVLVIMVYLVQRGYPLVVVCCSYYSIDMTPSHRFVMVHYRPEERDVATKCSF